MSLVAWYKLDGNTLDSSGNYLHGTASGVYEIGKINDCLYTSTSMSTPISLTDTLHYNEQGVSFGGWFKFKETEVLERINEVLATSDFTSPTGNLLGYNSYGGIGITWHSSDPATTPTVRITARTPSGLTNTSSHTIIDNTWIHYFAVWDRQNNLLSFYVNGEKIGDSIFFDKTDFPSRGFMINGEGVFSGNGPSTSLPVSIDDVRIYDHALTEKEVKELSKGKVLHYKFDDFQEPTENLLVVDNFLNNLDYHTVENYDNAYPDKPICRRLTRTSETNAYYNYSTNFPISGGKSYTFSFYMRLVSTTTEPNFIYAYMSDDVTADTSQVTTGTLYLNYNWQRVELTIDTEPTATSLDRIAFHTGANSIKLNTVFEIANPQLEAKNHATPFTPTIRTGLVKDISGYENNAELTESTTPRWMEEGIIGKGSYLFNGTTSGIERIGDFSDIKTISMWVKSQTVPTDSRVLLVHQPTGVGLGFYNNGYLILSSTGNSQRTAIISNFKNNDWNHIAVTYSDAKVPTCYINGVETTYSTTNNWSVPETTLFIGRRTSGSAFNGQIDDVRIYATALSADDVKELYQTKANLDKDGNMSVMNLNQIDTTNLEVKTNGILNSADISEVGVSNGLVAWYPLDGNTRDYTEYRNDATNYGATIASGLDQLCYSFDGVDDLIESSNSEALNQTESFSLSVWIKPFSFPSFSTVLAKGRSSSWFLTNYVLGLSNNKIRFKGTFSNNIELDSQIVLIENSWYNIICTYDNDLKASRIFINSIKDNNESLNGKTPTSVNEPLFIGVQGELYSPFNGLIQDVRIYNRALSPEEIKILYELRKNKKTHFTHDNKVFIPGKFNEVY